MPLIAAPLLMLPQLASAASVCHVDPTGTFGMPFADIDAALAFGRLRRVARVPDRAVSATGAGVDDHEFHLACVEDLDDVVVIEP